MGVSPPQAEIDAQVWALLRFRLGLTGVDATGRRAVESNVAPGEQRRFVLEPSPKPPWVDGQALWRRGLTRLVHIEITGSVGAEPWTTRCRLVLVNAPI